MKKLQALIPNLSVSLLGIAVAMAGNSLLLPAPAYAQGGVPLWTNQAPGQLSFAGIVADTVGNVFVNGSGIVIKYSSDGVPLWTNLGGVAIAVDASDNVFIAGNGTIAYSNAGVPRWTNQPGGRALALDSSGKVFVEDGYETIAYSNSGVPLWTNRHTDISSSGRYKIAVDSSGKVFVAGTDSSANGGDYLTIAYSNDGVQLWTNRYNGAGNASDFTSAIAVDATGNVFVTGGSGGYYATIKYSTAGVPLWTNRYNNGPWTPSDSASAIVVDGQSNVIVTGSSAAVDGGGYTDYATLKYSNAGVALWTNRYDGIGQYSDYPSAIAVDGRGNVFVTGISMYNLPGSPRPADYATIAYSNEGVPLWTNAYSGPDDVNSWAKAIAVDHLGNVFVTGDSWNGSYHWTTLKYSSSVPPPVHLDFQKLNNELVLSWTNAGFTLQTAPAVTGPFTNLPAATSPYTNPIAAPQQFFRLMGN